MTTLQQLNSLPYGTRQWGIYRTTKLRLRFAIAQELLIRIPDSCKRDVLVYNTKKGMTIIGVNAPNQADVWKFFDHATVCAKIIAKSGRL